MLFQFQQYQSIHEKYVILNGIGKGAQGESYLLEDLEQSPGGKTFVVGKCLVDDLLAEHEADTLRTLNHKNNVKFLEYFTYSGRCWLIMEHCNDGDLEKLLNSKRQDHMPLGKTEIVNIFSQIMKGVQYLHSKLIVHRDIKPSNIFQIAGNVKIGDFGIARAFDAEQLMMTFVGTYRYMSPEMLKNKGYSQQTDLWACGCVLYELCCLEPLINQGNLMALEIIKSGNYPKSITAHDSYFNEAFCSLICEDPSQRMSAETFLKNYFNEIENARKRVLLVGMVGVGKSSLGNLIAGREVFKTSDGVAGCTIDHKVFRSNDTGITIIDTMGMADPNETEAEIRRKISEALEATTDGVDLIFFCMNQGRVTKETYVVFQSLMQQFGYGCQTNLCLLLTKSGRKYVLGERDNLLQNQTKWLKEQRDDKGEAERMFREIHDASRQSVLFVDNPPKDCDTDLDKEIRDACRSRIIQFILSTNVKKFTSEAALRAREEAEEHATQIINFRQEILNKESQLNQQKISAATYQAESEKWRKRCQLQIQYDFLKSSYILEKRQRELAHERFCPRKKCKTWLAILDKKRLFDSTADIPIVQLWFDHAATCKGCGACEVCRLEHRLGEAYANREQVIQDIEAGVEFNEKPDIKASRERLQLLTKKEWKDYAEKCTIL